MHQWILRGRSDVNVPPGHCFARLREGLGLSKTDGGVAGAGASASSYREQAVSTPGAQAFAQLTSAVFSAAVSFSTGGWMESDW